MSILREPIVAETDSDEDYSLDSIVERRVVNGETRYFLKWKCNKGDFKVVKRNLDCPVIMASFEKSSKEKKSSKSDTKDKKKAVTNCTTSVVADISTEDKRKVQHSKTCKSHLQSKKADAEDKSKDKKQKHITTEECAHQEHKNKDDKLPSTKLNQQDDVTANASDDTVTVNIHGNLAETSAEKEKGSNS